MQAITGTLGRYIGWRFVTATLAIFVGIIALTALIDYVEMMRRASDLPNPSPLLAAEVSLFRVPQIGERLMPFCILIATMSCFLNLSRRNELVVARAAGISAWQFVAPAVFAAFVLGVLATVGYNPLSANLQEKSKKLEYQLFGSSPTTFAVHTGTFWIGQRTPDGEAIINAASSADQGAELSAVTIYRFNKTGAFVERIDAHSAILESKAWRLSGVRGYPLGQMPYDRESAELPTNLTRAQVRENVAVPESVSFWQLPQYITTAEHVGLAAAGYRLQFQKLLARPFLLAAVVLLASAVSLRFFRFGGVQNMVLSGVLAGFLLYVLSKVTDDMTKAGLMHPVAAAWLGVLIAGVVGITALLYQEDG
jgi:lipopolysaccharide export system permease protein